MALVTSISCPQWLGQRHLHMSSSHLLPRIADSLDLLCVGNRSALIGRWAGGFIRGERTIELTACWKRRNSPAFPSLLAPLTVGELD